MLVVFLLPIVTYRGTTVYLGLDGIAYTARISPSYILLGCGLVYQPTLSIPLLMNGFGVTNATRPLYNGSAWRCR